MLAIITPTDFFVFLSYNSLSRENLQQEIFYKN